MMLVWHVFPEVEVPFFYLKSHLKRMLGMLDTAEPLRKLEEQLRLVLTAEPSIQLCEEPE